MSNTLVIVGAGFCGTVLATALLRRPPAAATDILLVERGSEIGRGVAYAAREFPYLLNVPAARLSANSSDPMEFLRFARRRVPDADGEDFLPRSLYGDYLQDMLLHAERNSPAHVRLVRICDEALRVTRGGRGGRFTVEFTQRAAVMADRVVLAVGNPPPPLHPWAAGIRHHKAYSHDPWTLPNSLTADHSVLIVGNGLTMADVVLTLARNADRAPLLHTISRRGLVPLTQSTFRPSAVRGDGTALLACADSLRQVLAMIRDLAREVESRGGDWREVVTFVRHLAPALWPRLPASEQRRFLRHLQGLWDVHRHRLPQQMGARLASLRRQGRLQVNAGRIDSAVPVGDQLRVTWRPRGTDSSRALTVDLVVNATGPDFALKRGAIPLLSSLREAGMVTEDARNLGLRTSRFGTCVGAQDRVTEDLFYLGPMLRADHWEATAATELRDHAERLAAHLAG
jgi:uncharacterized NAD(P)/FAD-binding protein YdhS